ncbi:MAG: MmgE/PrpD family protein [Ectothiorhodospiraceae bacterium]|nr:MmgE/PrpD family protein [Chromatiales bacterium]MCP5155973.1 MmgE/PrpD family protein [Ectothiorhodospiraceae bacterium]
MEQVTEKLCERIVALGHDDLGEAAIAKAQQLFLDGLAVAVAGTVQETPPSVLAAHVRELGGAETATVIGFGFKTNPVQAAYVNGSSMHVLDFEPMWSPANHQLSTQLPAALALAEHHGGDGRDVATAMVKGIELMGWLREASGQYDATVVRFHPPGQVGPLGAAVTAAHMLGLDRDQLVNAIAIAGSRAGSLLANAGTDTKSTHCGLACAMGLDAAMLAARGFSGNRRVLEDDRGYAALFFGLDVFRFELMERYGPPWRVVDPGYAIKMFPSQFGTHFVITAGLELHPRIQDPERIRRVHIAGPPMHYVNRPRPETGLAGKFSFQYTAACALLDGKVVMSSFEDAHRFAPRMERLLDKITVDMRADIPGRFEEMYVDMEVELDDGTTLSTRCHGPRGKWGLAPITVDEHLVKVRDCLGLRLSSRDVERVIELGSNLTRLGNAELREVMAIVARAE